MPIPLGTSGELDGRHGGRRISLAELRRQLDEPASLPEASRQRLLDVVHTLDRIRALGDGFNRVQASKHVSAALRSRAVAGGLPPQPAAAGTPV